MSNRLLSSMCVLFEKVKTWLSHGLVFTEGNSLKQVKFLPGKCVSRVECE